MVEGLGFRRKATQNFLIKGMGFYPHSDRANIVYSSAKAALVWSAYLSNKENKIRDLLR